MNSKEWARARKYATHERTQYIKKAHHRALRRTLRQLLPIVQDVPNLKAHYHPHAATRLLY